MFRYKVPVFENGKKTWQDEYQKLAPIGQYDSVAALRKDGLVPKAPDTASLTPERTQLLSEFVERNLFPGSDHEIEGLNAAKLSSGVRVLRQTSYEWFSHV
jgi:hypothetical protein